MQFNAILYCLEIYEQTTFEENCDDVQILIDIEIDETAARKLLKEDLKDFIYRVIKDESVAQNLLEKLKEIGKLHKLQQALGINDKEDFEDSFKGTSEMLECCGPVVSREIAVLFFTDEKQKLDKLEDQIKEMFPTSYKFVFQKLLALEVFEISAIAQKDPQKMKEKQLKEYQIKKLLNQPIDTHQAQEIKRCLQEVFKKMENKLDPIFEKLREEGALYISTFNECSEEELMSFNLQKIHIFKMKKMIQNYETSRLLQSDNPYIQEAQSLKFKSDQSISVSSGSGNDQNHFEKEECKGSERGIKLLDQRSFDYIERLITQYENQPESFFQTLIAILKIFKKHLIKNLDNKNLEIKQVDQKSEKQIISLIGLLNKLHKEEWIVESKSLEEFNQRIEDQNWQKAILGLLELIREAMALDYMYLFNLYEKIQNQRKQLQDKDVLLLMGKTGVGKSTTALFLSGVQFIQTQIQGLDHLEPSKNYDTRAKQQVKCSPFAVSETKFITPIPIELEECEIYNKGSKIYVCDSPGFEDTEGPEVDIINSIGIVLAIQECKSIRLAIQLSYQSIGDRGDGIKSMAKILSGMMPRYNSEDSPISFIFSKYPENMRNSISANIKNILDNHNKLNDDNQLLMQLLREMVAKTKNNNAIIIDPLKSDRNNILEKILDTRKIDYPVDLFKQNFSQNSINCIRNQLNLFSQQIENALKAKKYDVVSYLLDQLKKLSEILPDFASVRYEDAKTQVKESYLKKVEEITAQFEKNFQDQGTLTEDDLSEYKKENENSKLINGLNKNHYEDDFLSSEQLEINLKIQLKVLLQKMKDSQIFDAEKVFISISKIKLSVSQFPMFNHILTEALNHLTLQLNNQINQLNCCKTDENFDLDLFIQNSRNLMRNLKNSQHLINNQTLDQNFKDKLNVFILALKSDVEDLNQVTKVIENLSDNDLQKISEQLNFIKLVQTHPRIKKVFEQKTIDEIFNDAVQKILDCCQNIATYIQNYSSNETNIGVIENLLKIFDKMRTNEIIRQKSSDIYHICIRDLKSLIDIKMKNLDKFKEELQFEEFHKIDIPKFVKEIKTLEKSKWIQKNFKLYFEQTLENVYEQLIEKYNNQINVLKLMRFQLGQHENLNKGLSISIKLEQIEKFFKQNQIDHDQLDQINEQFMENFNTQIKQTFENINEILSKINLDDDTSLLQLNFSYLDKAILYTKSMIELTPKNNVVDLDFETMLSTLKKIIKEYKDKFIQMLQRQNQKVLNQIEKKSVDEEFMAQNLQPFLAGLKNKIKKIQKIEKYKELSLLMKKEHQQEILNSLKQCKNEIIGAFRDHQETIKEVQNQIERENMIKLARIMKQMDYLIKDEETFESIYLIFRKIAIECATSEQQHIFDLLNKREYFDASNRIQHFKQNEENIASLAVLSKIQKDVYFHFSEIFKNINQGITINSVKEIEDLKDGKEGVQQLSIILDKQICDKLYLYLSKIETKLMKEFEEMAQRIKEKIKDKKYSIAQNEIDDLQSRIIHLMDPIGNEMQIKLTQLQNELNQMIITALQQYDNGELFDMKKFQKIHFKNLIENLNHKKFEKQQLDLEEKILGAIKKSIKEEMEKSQTLEKKKKYLQNLEEFLKTDFLDQISKDVQKEIEDQRYYIDNKSKEDSEIFKQLISSKKYDQIKKELNGQYKDDEDIKIYLKNNLIQEKMNSFNELFQKHFEDCKFEYCLQQLLPQIYDFINLFQENFETDLEQLQSQIKDVLKEQIDLSLTRIQSKFQSSEGPQHFKNKQQRSSQNVTISKSNIQKSDASQEKTTNGEHQINDYELSIQWLMIYFKQKQDEKVGQALKYFVGDNDKKFEEKLTYLQTLFKKEYDLFQEDFKSLDISRMIHKIKKMNEWETIFYNQKEMLKNNDFSDTGIEIIFQNMNQYSHEILIKQVFDELEKNFQDIKLTLETQNPKYEKDINDMYILVQQKLHMIEKAAQLNEFKDEFEIDKMNTMCQKYLDDKMNSFEDQFNKIMTSYTLNQEECNTINIILKHHESIIQNIESKKQKSREQIEKYRKQIKEKSQELLRNLDIRNSLETQCNVLIQLKNIMDNIQDLKSQIDEKIKKFLDSVARNSQQDILKLGLHLQQDPIGQILIQSYQHFQGFKNHLFNSKANSFKVEQVLKLLKGNDNIETKTLQENYNDFQKIYKKLIEHYIERQNYSSLENLVNSTKQLFNIPHRSIENSWNKHVSTLIPQLAANVFAIYTLMNASSFIKLDPQEQNSGISDNYLFTPHAGQVISIFRLLGIGYGQSIKEKLTGIISQSSQLQNNLIEIGTGEGKSVTLAVSSVILALLGFDVYCACYSDYLSSRDREKFDCLFTRLNVQDKIKYGTFNQLCESLINKDFDIREKVREYIDPNLNMKNSSLKIQNKLSILLIDEVDVFFDKNFYGNTYCPSLKLQDKVIEEFTKSLWDNRNTKNLNLQLIQSSEEYKAVLQRYPGWDKLILEIVKEMIHCLKNLESHSYILNEREQVIGYQVLDSFVKNAVSSYNTLFAYYKETIETEKLTLETLKKNIFLNIKCGEFSYAEIIRKFNYIIGVTGTLSTLTEHENRILEGYNMKLRTYIPSVFGKKKLKLQEDYIKIADESTYFQLIRQEIDARPYPEPINNSIRPVLVFFESSDHINKFISSQDAEFQNRVNYMLDYSTKTEKIQIISNASNIGKITLLPREQGRGTDFEIREDKIVKNGGMHVIQTFFSEEISEEVQIRGRTARHGNDGSYSLILLDKSLEKYHITTEELEKNKKDLQKFLEKKREKYIQTIQGSNKLNMEMIKSQNEKAEQFLLQIKNNDSRDKIQTYLVNLNKGPSFGQKQSRTLCLIDATGSMQLLLINVKKTVETMFMRANETLIDHGFDVNSFLIQFAVFRNYNSEKHILQESDWSSSSKYLKEYINGIKSEGGMGNEAIEVAFQFAEIEQTKLLQQDSRINQILLIGDAPPNTYKEVLERRKNHGGEIKWQKTRFPQPGKLFDIVKSLSDQNVIINTFYLDNKARTEFEKIADIGKGSCQKLEINTSNGAETLTNLVTLEILRQCGDFDGSSDKLIQTYKNKYCYTN